MRWVKDVLSGPSGQASSKRVALLMATLSLSAATVLLSVAAVMGYSVAGELGAVALPLAGLGGWSYTQKREIPKETNE